MRWIVLVATTLLAIGALTLGWLIYWVELPIRERGFTRTDWNTEWVCDKVGIWAVAPGIIWALWRYR
jgi:hypothetical protein